MNQSNTDTVAMIINSPVTANEHDGRTSHPLQHRREKALGLWGFYAKPICHLLTRQLEASTLSVSSLITFVTDVAAARADLALYTDKEPT